MNTAVNFELAKLLKEKGFDEECNSLFIHEIRNGDTEWKLIELFERNNKDTYDFLLSCDMDWQKHYLRPTIAEVVMWLYEKHGIWIDVSPCMTFKDGNLRGYEENSFSFLYSVKYGTEELFLANSNKPLVFQKGYNSPTESYEAAIKYCLENIVK